jgi:hypothetical protein
MSRDREKLPVIKARLVKSLSELDWFRALPKIRAAELQPIREPRQKGGDDPGPAAA